MTLDATTADAGYRLADELIRAGELDRALATLDGLAARAHAAADTLNAVRSLRLAAVTARLRADLPGAIDRARRCLAIARDAAGAPGGTLPAEIAHAVAPVRLQAILDLAGWLLELDEPAEAADRLREALAEIPAPDANRRAGVLRRLASALVAAGDAQAARLALIEAAELPTDAATSARIAVDAASLGYVMADPVGDTLAAQARARAESLEDPGALTRLALLDAARAIDGGSPDEALDALRRARTLALDAVLPIEYLAAAAGIAQVSEALGDRSCAYASLATGWATVADLLGADVAQATFAPQLRDLKNRWGDAEFAAVRSRYENRTRS